MLDKVNWFYVCAAAAPAGVYGAYKVFRVVGSFHPVTGISIAVVTGAIELGCVLVGDVIEDNRMNNMRDEMREGIDQLREGNQKLREEVQQLRESDQKLMESDQKLRDEINEIKSDKPIKK